MIFQHRDGELRIYSGATPGAAGKTTRPKYLEVLFVNAGFSAPIKRPEVSETLVMDRGVYTADAEYKRGLDDEKLVALPLSFTFKMADTTMTTYFQRILQATSPCVINGKTCRSSKGESAISGISTPDFADTAKMAWDVGVLWDGVIDQGFRWREVLWKESTINEGEDEVTITANGEVYGDVTRITAFWAGTTINS